MSKFRSGVPIGLCLRCGWVTALQREEPVAAGVRTHGKRHQADVRLDRERQPERQLGEVLLTQPAQA